MSGLNFRKWYGPAGAELELFVRGAIINIIKYNIYFTLLYMSCKKNLYNLVLFK